MEPAFNCKTKCLLQDLLECKSNYLTTNKEKIAILVHQVAESQSPEKITKLNAAQELNKLLQCLINGCNQCYPETGTHYDSEVEVSEEEGEESDEEEEEEPYGSDCASEKESQNSSDEY